jgi:MFS family permease
MRGVQGITAAGFSVGVALFALSPSVWVAVPMLFIAGALSAAFLAINQTALQLHVEDDVRGRVMSVSLLTWGVMPIGQLGVGALADATGAPWALTLACMVSLALVGLIVMRYPTLR